MSLCNIVRSKTAWSSIVRPCLKAKQSYTSFTFGGPCCFFPIYYIQYFEYTDFICYESFTVVRKESEFESQVRRNKILCFKTSLHYRSRLNPVSYYLCRLTNSLSFIFHFCTIELVSLVFYYQ